MKSVNWIILVTQQKDITKVVKFFLKKKKSVLNQKSPRLGLSNNVDLFLRIPGVTWFANFDFSRKVVKLKVVKILAVFTKFCCTTITLFGLGFRLKKSTPYHFSNKRFTVLCFGQKFIENIGKCIEHCIIDAFFAFHT